MIRSKIAAVRFLRQFREISEFIGGSLTELEESASVREHKAAAKPVGKILGAIEREIYSPIIAAHPALCPIELLGLEKSQAKYNVMFCLGEDTPEEVVASAIAPDDAYAILEACETRQPGIFWLELA